MFKCFSSWKGWAVLAIAVLLGVYLVIWHQQHVAVALPFLVILACLLMHAFIHRGHDGHHSRHDNDTTK